MHSYLKSIGFSNLVRKTDIDIILQDVIRHYDEKKVIETQDHRLMAELSRSYGCDVGITLCGEYDDEGLWRPTKDGLGMRHVFEELNRMYGDGFIKYE